MKMLRQGGKLMILFLIWSFPIFAQGFWTWNQRTHSELKWFSVTTSHFRIHYHNGLEEIAKKTALIAEQVYSPIMDQLQVKDFGYTDITITAEDEIMNGYALPTNQIFIWVNQNSAAGYFTGDEKWLKTVIAHEFQHIVALNAMKTWLGIYNLAFVPSWFIEGLAEYYTEKWRVGRSDLRLKIHTYKNRMNKLDPHDSGFARVAYIADLYGDSTLTKITHWRHPIFKYFNFRQAFKDATGRNLKDFEEDWRRTMNTYYYSLKGQKTGVNEIGRTFSLKGFKDIQHIAFSEDSSKVVIVGKKSETMHYTAIYVVSTDSTHKTQELTAGKFTSKPAWSPDGKYIFIGELHRGKNGSLISDIRLINVKNGHKKWLTKNLKANYPVCFPDSERLAFIAHPGESSNIYILNLKTDSITRISHFSGDIQLMDLNISHNGKRLIFSIQDETGFVDIAEIDDKGEHFRKITKDTEEDFKPIFLKQDSSVVFTSYRNGTPNLYLISSAKPDTIRQLTDVTEGVFSEQLLPGDNSILLSTVPDVDTSRYLIYSDFREITPVSLTIRNRFASWRNKRPEIKVPDIDYNASVSISPPEKYRFYRNLRHITSLILPGSEDIAGFTIWQDGIGKHLFILSGDYPYKRKEPEIFLSYTNTVFRPFFNLSYLYHTLSFFMPYDGNILLEIRDIFSIKAILPFNSGNSLYANHSVTGEFRLQRRFPLDGIEFSAKLPPSESGRENLYLLQYRFLSRLPEKNSYFLPSQGYGFLAGVELSEKILGGKTNYIKLTGDFFFNKKIANPLVLYGRIKYVSLSGKSLAQDRVFISTDPPLYLSGMNSLEFMFAPFFFTRENLYLRGNQDVIRSDRMLVSTLEIRLPLVREIPVRFFGINTGATTISLFLDNANPLNSDIISLQTAGAEIRTALKIKDATLFHIGYGFGARIKDKGISGISNPVFFLRLGLINPF